VKDEKAITATEVKQREEGMIVKETSVKRERGGTELCRERN